MVSQKVTNVNGGTTQQGTHNRHHFWSKGEGLGKKVTKTNGGGGVSQK